MAAPVALADRRELLLDAPRRPAFDTTHDVADRVLRRHREEHVDVILRQHAFDDLDPELAAHLPDNLPDPPAQLAGQDRVAAFCRPYDVIAMVENRVTALAFGHLGSSSILVVMGWNPVLCDWLGARMGQMGFFELEKRCAGLDARNDPWARIAAVVSLELFRPRLEAVWRTPPVERKSKAGRKPWDAVVMLKAIVPCELYNLSDDQVELQLRDRLSFMRFPGLGLEDPVPGARTVRLYREQLAQAALVETLLDGLGGGLKARGWLAMGGRIVDASIMPAPKQRGGRDGNATIKNGKAPDDRERQPARRARKDTGARRAKRRGKSHFCYKSHVNVDRRHKPVRRYHVTDAAVHDSQAVDAILDGDNTPSQVRADSACRSAGIEAKLKENGLKYRLHRQAHRNRPLGEREKQGSRTRSTIRARVEQVFGAQSNDMGGRLVRAIGLVRLKARVGLKNLACNMRRLVQPERMAAAPT